MHVSSGRGEAPSGWAAERAPGAAGSVIEVVLGVVRRRFLLIAVVTVVATALGRAVIVRVPEVYEARAVVHVEQGRMPGSFQQAGVVVPALSEVIGQLRQEALSRDTLRELVSDLRLYERPPPESGLDGLVVDIHDRLQGSVLERARKDIQVDIVKRYGQEYVEISVRARTPELAVRVVNRMVDRLAANNRDLRIRLAQDVRTFLDNELLKSKRQLEEAESRLRAFREEHRDGLAETEARFFERLYALKGKIEERRREIADADDRRAEIEVRLKALPRTVRPPASSSERDALLADLARLEAEDAQLARDGQLPSHWDRKRLRGAIEDTRRRLATLDKGGAGGEPAPPGPGGSPGPGAPGEKPAPRERLDPEALALEIERGEMPRESADAARILLAELRPLVRKVEALERDQERDLAEVDRLESIAGSIAPTRQELQKLQTAVEDASRMPRALLADIDIIDKFLTAERAGRTDQLKTIDPAEMPGAAASPNRLLLTAGALAAALALGLGLGYLLEMRRRTFRTPAEVEAEMGTSVLAILPQVSDPLKSVFPDEGEVSILQLDEGPAAASAGGKLAAPSEARDEGLERARVDAEARRHRREVQAALAAELHVEPGAPTFIDWSLAPPDGTTPRLSEPARPPRPEPAPADEPVPPVDLKRPGVLSYLDWKGEGRAAIWTEQLGRLRHAVLHHPRVHDARVIMVTSATASEGKTTVALGLSRALARSLDHWALLVETDMRRPSLASRVGLVPDRGLAELVTGHASVADVIQRSHVRKLSFICAGKSPVDAADLAASAQMRRLTEELRDRYPNRIVVLDTPPVLATPEPLSLSLAVDGIIFVVQAGRTPRALVRNALSALPRDKILGIVLNSVSIGWEARRYIWSYYADRPKAAASSA